MEQTLGYCSAQSTRFAPKFSRFLFFDVEKEGSLYCILSQMFKYFQDRDCRSAQQMSVSQLTYTQFN